jgi:hypothetical protein
MIWVGFFTASMLVYYFLSSGDFSFLLVSVSFGEINCSLRSYYIVELFFCSLTLLSCVASDSDY